MSDTVEIPAGESVIDKLRVLATWLVEDSDLPRGEANDFARALDAAIEALEAGQ